jgi:hypothetical protein
VFLCVLSFQLEVQKILEKERLANWMGSGNRPIIVSPSPAPVSLDEGSSQESCPVHPRDPVEILEAQEEQEVIPHLQEQDPTLKDTRQKRRRSGGDDVSTTKRPMMLRTTDDGGHHWAFLSSTGVRSSMSCKKMY